MENMWYYVYVYAGSLAVNQPRSKDGQLPPRTQVSRYYEAFLGLLVFPLPLWHISLAIRVGHDMA